MELSTNPESCGKHDTLLQKWTFVRYVAMGAIMMVRIYKIKAGGKAACGQARVFPYCDHPKLTTWMNDTNVLMGFLLAGCIFIQSEGVGLAIYFAASAFMDNCAIYFIDSDEFCQYVKQIALYSMALVTFLPTCAIAYRLQGTWYDKGQWAGKKAVFVILMVAATVASFLFRLFLVYQAGWAQIVENLMDESGLEVVTALLVPPAVDVLQTLLLIAASLKSGHSEYDQLPDAEKGQAVHVHVEEPCEKTLLHDNETCSTCSEPAGSLLKGAESSYTLDTRAS